MDAWNGQTPSPAVKFENSPAESFLSAPGDNYPSLFGSPSSTTMNPLDIMSPQSYPEDQQTADFSVLAGFDLPETPSAEQSPAPEKRSAKKRKSWGQVLPEPKTNLPPRKRAKTDDEKEQRRVERVLRNRRAAQSSRERKRLEVEALEQRNKELETALMHARKTNVLLVEQLSKFRRDSGVASSSFDSFRPNPVTFSQELFGSQDGHSSSLDQNKASLVDELLMSAQSNNTVNPASLSPALTPVPEDEEDGFDGEDAEPATTASPAAEAATASDASPDLTQHPAEVLCFDLQCQSAEVPRPWPASQQGLHPALGLFLQLHLLLISTSAILSVCRRPLTQIAMSLKAGFSLPPTRPILNTIIWLVTQPSPSRRRRPTTPSTSSTSTNSSTTTKQQPAPSRVAAASQPTSSLLRSTNLRLRSLRKILTCSPILARPLMDATMEVLRLVSSEGCEFARSVDGEEAGPSAAAAPDEQGRWLNGAELPSKEVLLTLLWALKVEQRRLDIRRSAGQPVARVAGRTIGVPKVETPTSSYVLKVVRKRGWEEQHYRGENLLCGKRRRIG